MASNPNGTGGRPTQISSQADIYLDNVHTQAQPMNHCICFREYLGHFIGMCSDILDLSLCYFGQYK